MPKRSKAEFGFPAPVRAARNFERVWVSCPVRAARNSEKVWVSRPNERQPETPQNLDPLTAVKCIRKPDFRNLVPVILDLSVAGHRYRPAREHILWKHVSTDELINYV